MPDLSYRTRRLLDSLKLWSMGHMDWSGVERRLQEMEESKMSLEVCVHCKRKITQDGVPNGGWKHHTYPASTIQCTNPEPGMGLHDLIKEFWQHPATFAPWSHEGQYTENAILHGLRFQATLHWNNCGHPCVGTCLANGKSTADKYMIDLAHGRIDMHPYDDQEVSTLAFEIHNAAVIKDPKHGKPGIMTMSYVSGPGSSQACNCYSDAYARWVVEKGKKAEQKAVAALPSLSEEDRYWDTVRE